MAIASTVTRVDPADFDWQGRAGAAAALRSVLESAASEDGAAPVDEATLLRLRHGLAGSDLWSAGSAGFAWRHDGALDLVVAPTARGAGLGTALASAATAEPGPLTAWSHGNHPAAAALAGRLGFDRVRDLWVMRRSLRDLPEVDGAGSRQARPTGAARPTEGCRQARPTGAARPAEGSRQARPTEGARPTEEARPTEGSRQARPTEGARPVGDVEIRPFRVGRDEDAFLAVNAAAFVDHPEQGRLTRAGLDERIAEPWFDPAGFFLAWRGDKLAGYHWTKVHQDPDGAYGEVYVVGIAPAAQGGGLGRLLTLTGLQHLAAQGLERVLLYVEGDNAPAIAVYSRLGFEHAAADTHVQYARR